MIRTRSHLSVVLLATLVLVASGCRRQDPILSFDPLTNLSVDHGVAVLPMDMNMPVHQGIRIPSEHQVKGGKFIFSLRLVNTTGREQPLHYKVYYQNESYKFPETLAHSDSLNPECHLNFYGSWPNAKEGFRSTPVLKPGESIEILDSLLIQGNPRDDERFFGPPPIHTVADSGLVASTIRAIKNNPAWFASIQEKAAKERLTLEEQLSRDALWVIANPPSDARVNNRWQNNPRVGEYSFLVAVATPEALAQLPAPISDISQKGPDGKHQNPYWFLRHGPGKTMQGLWSMLSPVRLRTSAKINLAEGVHVPCLTHPDGLCGMGHYGPNCGDSDHQFEYSQVSQFFHHLPQGWELNNIPVAYDVTSDTYTPSVHRNLVELHPAASRKPTDVAVSKEACTTVWWDSEAKVMRIRTPGSDTLLKKENEGLKTRIGLTYGKWRAKVKFPDMINKHNMWTGLTHAVWLLYQSEHPWNNRSECPGGYIPHNAPDKKAAERVPFHFYSEIDIEIAKESRFWPEASYTRVPELYQKDDPASNREVIVTCTNWDLACKSGESFVNAIFPWESPLGKPYVLHRWDEWNGALTLKSPYPHDSLFGQWAWYEIDWQPTRIIWRLGKDLDHMQEIGYMDRSVTDVPDNQMIMVISQEFHFAKWWPLAPQSQDDIPYPAKDFMTEIAEIRID